MSYLMHMACLTTTRTAQIQARITEWEARKVLASAYFEFLMGSEGMESFKFDSGEAMSWAKYTSADDFMLNVVAVIDRWLDYYRNQLNGTGIVRLNLSRGR